MILLTIAGKDKPETQPKSRTPTVTSTTAELYLWEQDDGHFLKQADIVGSIGPRSSCYYITATTDKGQQLISHKISSELNARWSAKLSSATWNHTTRLGYSSSWCMKFRSIEDFKEFRKAYSACLNEAIDAANARVSLKLLNLKWVETSHFSGWRANVPLEVVGFRARYNGGH